jgi:glycosyltransferase involved in cell wall biosynthesis
MYISTFDTMIYDRAKATEHSLLSRLYEWSDALSMNLADRIILETRVVIRDLAKRFGVQEGKFFHIFLAADEKVVAPKAGNNSNGEFLVHFHGEYAPFHGVKYILQAADVLRDESVQFQIIGRGITYERNMQLARKLKLENCNFIDWVPYADLAEYMSRADCCLGFFGKNPRVLRVLTNKVIESIAVGKPLVTSKNEPVQELLKDGESAFLIERANPNAIADAIRKLRDNEELKNRIGKNGHEVFLQNCTLKIFSKKLRIVIDEMLNRVE